MITWDEKDQVRTIIAEEVGRALAPLRKQLAELAEALLEEDEIDREPKLRLPDRPLS